MNIDYIDDDSETVISSKVFDHLIHIGETLKYIVFKDSVELFFNRSEKCNLVKTVNLHCFEFSFEVKCLDIDLLEVTDNLHDSSSDLK